MTKRRLPARLTCPGAANADPSGAAAHFGWTPAAGHRYTARPSRPYGSGIVYSRRQAAAPEALLPRGYRNLRTVPGQALARCAVPLSTWTELRRSSAATPLGIRQAGARAASLAEALADRSIAAGGLELARRVRTLAEQLDAQGRRHTHLANTMPAPLDYAAECRHQGQALAYRHAASLVRVLLSPAGGADDTAQG